MRNGRRVDVHGLRRFGEVVDVLGQAQPTPRRQDGVARVQQPYLERRDGEGRPKDDRREHPSKAAY